MRIIDGVKNKFQDRRIPDCQNYYDSYIEKWKRIYSIEKVHKDWLQTQKRSIDDPNGKKRTKDALGMAKFLCEELAGLVFNEECEINVTSGSESENDPVKQHINDILQQNAFWKKFQNLIEYEMALGGAAIKLSHDSEKLTLNYLMADQFIPIGWTNKQVTEGVFVTQEKRDRYYYTLMEWHLLKTAVNEAGEKAVHRVIEYNLFMSGDPDNLGTEINVNRIYPDIKTPTIITANVQTFVYFSPNVANNADFALPLGMSIFANAVDTLKQLDVAFDSFGREFVLGKKRVIVPASAIRSVTIAGSSEQLRYFDTSDEAYEAFDADDRDNLQIQDNTVVLRVEEHVAAINALLNILCMQTGLTAGTFSFDVAQGLRTATEIISANSKTYKTIKGHQNIVREAIEELIGSAIEFAKIYLELPADVEYDLSIGFDDSIVTDKNADIDNNIKLVSAGLKSRMQAMIDLYDWTEDRALEELNRIREESMMHAEQLPENEEPIE